MANVIESPPELTFSTVGTPESSPVEDSFDTTASSTVGNNLGKMSYKKKLSSDGKFFGYGAIH
jgi:hypothetical protein